MYLVYAYGPDILEHEENTHPELWSWGYSGIPGYLLFPELMATTTHQQG